MPINKAIQFDINVPSEIEVIRDRFSAKTKLLTQIDEMGTRENQADFHPGLICIDQSFLVQ